VHEVSHADDYERRYMDPGERVIFREKIVSRTAFGVSVAFALVFGLVGLLALGAVAFGAVPAAAGVGFGAPFVVLGAFMGITGVMFSVFRVMVTASHVHVHFGWAKRKIPMDAIGKVCAVRLRGFKQGKVSMGLDGVVRTWVGNSQSGRGVEIHYQDGARKHVLTIGSEQPEQFVETIERARSATSRGDTARVRIGQRAADEAAAEEEAALSTEDDAHAPKRRRAR
jgi:hypothetical protein